MSCYTAYIMTYDRAYCIDFPFKNLFAQTIELLIVDDTSTDNAEQEFEGF